MTSMQHLDPPLASFRPPGGEGRLFYDPVLRLGISWLDTPPRSQPEGTAELAQAVAGIVQLAASRARAAGDFAALRDAVERALLGAEDSGQDPRESGLPEPPAIEDVDLGEAERLTALMRRQSGS
ncbi:hypothetical protein [Falsiroseomonas selenitidurans]|uniref:Uncharacterized protein n=1 Tax=Falsiroseomonas selenitidurans TaxID=2716335 RepID=A0ABX1E923_9PROT|nr:hypothetical protein [Falsiroseomonas selenitidurans]NKC33313.1 hypothetical protein [Falsiroseomonas selenitidurans]